ncbi:MAG: tRNA lysidine(34) synthetase TilS [Bacteroidales bacterium]|nr:tRNA lysidine(34) synthetase TilS [Bacteroidales bacterium]
MLERFISFASSHSLLNKEDKILLSVSGGIDSVALCKLFKKAEIPFDVVHCNYHLRGEESNRDEAFVTNLCKEWDIKLHIVHFDTNDVAVSERLSIETAARNLRYDYYQKLYEQYGYNKIATAHHLNDQAETFFVNLLRTTGINGICGIPLCRPLSYSNSNCKIIRPLMFASRKDIVEYTKDLSFVFDSTNSSDDYLRNRIRHHVIPELEAIRNNFPETLQKSMTQFGYTRDFATRVIKDFFQQEQSTGGTIIPVPRNYSETELCGYLYFALYEFGFNLTQIQDIAKSAASSGALFFSKANMLLVDRQKLIVRPVVQTNDEEIAPKLSFTVLHRKKTDIIPNDPNVAWLDYDKLVFPLSVTKKGDGDYFFPLGMTKKKKLSDFFIDMKFDQFTKSITFVLRSGNGDIAWIVGHRIDDRYKIDNQTVNILEVRLDK